MGFKCGIVGLPNSGKSTIFNALTASSVLAESYPFCTIDPNVGVVEINDHRLDIVREIVGSERKVPTFIEFVDIAGLVKGASHGEGLGNQFLSHIRGVDAIAHVVRCFTDGNVSHVEGNLDPIRDIEIVNLELVLSDLEVAERNVKKLEKIVKSGAKDREKELSVLFKAYRYLKEGLLLRNTDITQEEIEFIKHYQFLTLKPVIYVANVGEAELDKELAYRVKEFAEGEGAGFVMINGKLESELVDFPKEEREQFLSQYGFEGSAIETLAISGYKVLDLITFFTANDKEARAWTVKNGTKVVDAASKIHTDMSRGFIKAEVINFEVLKDVSSISEARDRGLVRVEGKDYIVQDGDLIYIRFRV